MIFPEACVTAYAKGLTELESRMKPFNTELLKELKIEANSRKQLSELQQAI